MDIIKIPYSKRAIKTEHGWFTGWDAFGNAKYINTVELAELSSYPMANSTAEKLKSECKSINIVRVYNDNETLAVAWDELEIIIDKLSEFDKISKTKTDLCKEIAASKNTKKALRKYVHLRNWLSSTNLPTFTQRDIDLNVVTEAEDIAKHERMKLIKNNLVFKIYDLVLRANSLAENINKGMYLANNTSSLDLYGRTTITRFGEVTFADVTTKTSDETIVSEALYPNSFSFNANIRLPKLAFIGCSQALLIPKDWSRQRCRERMRSSSEFSSK